MEERQMEVLLELNCALDAARGLVRELEKLAEFTHPEGDFVKEKELVAQDQKQPENPALDSVEADDLSPGTQSPHKKLFNLQGGSEAFCSRSLSIFSGLETAARTALSFLGDDNVLDGTFKRPPATLAAPKVRKLSKDLTKDEDRGMQKFMKSSSGVLGSGDDVTEAHDDAVVDEWTPLESFRNLPEPVLQTPGYLVNPARWKCYSLENEKDCGDYANATVALSFLRQQAAKHPDVTLGGVEQEGRRVLFNARPRRESGSKGQQNVGRFRSRVPHTKKQQIVNEKQTVSLQHLREQDEQQWSECLDEGHRIGVNATKHRCEGGALGSDEPRQSQMREKATRAYPSPENTGTSPRDYGRKRKHIREREKEEEEEEEEKNRDEDKEKNEEAA